MANITKRGDSYRIRVSMGLDVHKKQIFESVTYTPIAKTPKKREKEVQAFAEEFERKCKEGKYLSGEKISFFEYMKIWKSDWAEKHLTQRTLEDYERALDKHIVPFIGHFKLAKIQASDAQSIITRMIDSGLKPASVKKNFSAMNSVLKYAYKMNVVQENVCDRCELPKMETDTSLHYFTLEQSKRFLQALKTEFPHTVKAHTRVLKKTGEKYEVPEYTEAYSIPLQFQAYFMLAIYGGFRRSELLALNWHDIDFEHHMVSINKAVSSTNDGMIMKGTKTVSSVREIMLPASCFFVLRAWLKEEKDIAQKLGSKWEGIHDIEGEDFEDNRIFIQIDNGRPMDINTPYQRFQSLIDIYNEDCDRRITEAKTKAEKKQIEAEKLPHIRLHDLRHTSATLLLSEGCDIETVSRRMGHSQASVTLNVYGHALETKDTKASGTLEKLFDVG